MPITRIQLRFFILSMRVLLNIYSDGPRINPKLYKDCYNFINDCELALKDE